MVGCGGTSKPSQAQPLLWAGCHPLAQAARSPILPGLEHLQGWGSRSFSGQPAPVPTSPRLLGWVPRGCWAGRMSGKQAGRMAPCHALGPFFRSLLAFGPSLRCSFFSSCLGIRILELWRETAIACICEFLQRKDKDVQEKIKFLRGICTLCKCRDTSLNLDAFCQEKQLAENVQALIDEEPKHTLSSEIKQEAMMSFANMSTVETALEGKTESILNSCFNSVFFLPPELSIPAKEKELYNEVCAG
ncbi:uncharacterized protein LOC128090127 [Tympanuchus pallidicinctus]|uniref:uncharacterized protein LOC128090127 n=1 Tax=Tympanuchus pallidicinctus TaxID=109042 RepID=UPI002287240A|nr:uncharacterized protein LOC128090127 [Tympanuchus pallidicinctus]